MGRSSGDPGKMLSYVSGGLEQVGGWDVEVPKLGHALGSLRAQLASSNLAPGTEVAVADLDAGFDVLTKNQRHLDEFVADVAHGLLKADGYYQHNRPQPPEGPTGILTAPDTAIDAGPADRELALTEAAQTDAEAFLQLLEDARVLDAFEDYAPGTRDLLHVYDDLVGTAEFDELIAWMDQNGADLEDPLYAAAFYNALGAEGILATSTVLAAYADQHPGQNAQDLAEPFTTGFATATWNLDPRITAQLLDLGAVTDWETQSVHLAIMLTAPGDLYHPWFLSSAAGAIFFHPATNQPSMDGEEPPEPTRWLPHALVMRALADNPDASWDFASRSDDHLAEVIYPPEYHGIGDQKVLNQEVTWLGRNTDADPQGLYDLWSAATYLNAMGVPLEITYDEQHAQLAIQTGNELKSLLLDLTPGVSTLKAGTEVVTGQDPTTGQPVNRWLAGVGFIVSAATDAFFLTPLRALRNLSRGSRGATTPAKTLPDNLPRPPQQPPARTPTGPPLPVTRYRGLYYAHNYGWRPPGRAQGIAPVRGHAYRRGSRIGGYDPPPYMNDPIVQAELERAWYQSLPYSRPVLRGVPGSLKQEQGGWIIEINDPVTNQVTYRVHRVPAGTRDSLPGHQQLHQLPPNERPVAWFHTHPDRYIESGNPPSMPSTSDWEVTTYYGVPGIIIANDGYTFMMPPLPPRPWTEGTIYWGWGLNR